MQRRADEREAALLAELGEQDRRLRETIAATSEAERTRDAARAELVRVTARRRALIAQIAGRDSRFAAEIAEYRAQIASIAASPDPRKRAALARYAAGDRSGALDVLIDIQNAETASIAAGWRDLAERAMDQYARRELSLDDTITIVSRAAAISQSDTGLWRTLAGLLRQAGRNREAEEALSHVR